MSLLQEQARSLSRHGMKKHLRILPMYSGLPYPDQMKVFERVPPSVRKVILQSVKCLPSFNVEILSSLQVYTVQMWLEYKVHLKASSLIAVFLPAFFRSWWPRT